MFKSEMISFHLQLPSKIWFSHLSVLIFVIRSIELSDSLGPIVANLGVAVYSVHLY